MITALVLFALTIVPMNDPLAPLQLVHADVAQHGEDVQICIHARNESPEIVTGISITGNIRDASQHYTVFLSGATLKNKTQSGIAPGDTFHACGHMQGVTLQRDAVIQVWIR